EKKSVSPVRSGKGKGYMWSGDNEANVPKMFKKNVVPRKTRYLTVAKEMVAVELAKSISIDEQRTQQRSKASRLESLRQKKLLQKAKNNMRKINFKKAVAHKFKEYDQKLEALTNFNVFGAFEKAVQAKVQTEMKKLLLTHISIAEHEREVHHFYYQALCCKIL
nr:hypothetical protein [Tanacetum cinerariifolium]